MGCAYCGEQDESRLILSSRVVKGSVEQEWVCSNCLWRDEFVHEDGRVLPKTGLSEELRKPYSGLSKPEGTSQDTAGAGI